MPNLIISQNIIGRKTNFSFSLWFSLFIIIGIFLWPKNTLASAITAETIIKLTNEIRAENKITTLKINPLLTQAAADKGRAIIDQQLFQHNFDDRKFSAWVKETGYAYTYVGENLALDFLTAEGVIQAWLDSPTHKKNLLSSEFSEIGVAVINDKFQDDDTTLVVQIFGSPLVSPTKNQPVASAEQVIPPTLKTTEQTKTIATNIITGFQLTPEQLPTKIPKEELMLPQNLSGAILKINPDDKQLLADLAASGYWLLAGHQTDNRDLKNIFSQELNYSTLDFNSLVKAMNYNWLIVLLSGSLLAFGLYFKAPLYQRKK